MMHGIYYLVEVLLIDKVPMVSQQLISEIDHALRYATKSPDEWFGGIKVIFSGDSISDTSTDDTLGIGPIPKLHSSV